MKKLMLGLFIAFGISACSVNDNDLNVDCGADVDVPFTGFPLLCNYSVKVLPNNPQAILVNTQQKMDDNFTKHPNSCPVASDPNIDFTKNYLIGIFAGVKATSGYEIKMTSMVENNCEIVINFYEKGPQSGESISQTPTYPSDFILIPKTSKPIIFNRTVETSDNIVIGSFTNLCTGGDCQKFYQLNDFNILKFLNVGYGSYTFEQYKYTNTTKRGEYTLFLKSVPAEILALKGQTKTYGTPDDGNQGGIYFQLRQAGSITKIYIDKNDTADQTDAIKAFKKAIQDKIISLN
ncbi:protease complex subunit PrcB family protein [Flavobacterium sp. ANB]|uniref:protease complex subunit PrcB family protein n=1 Tax=unclassified Flavobacterium TaxID=196869 RepID=UPI0012B9BB8F|nr:MULTISPECIES: protease complex subunit PrcB family protein [unclassified Flavobacterium]MBF4518801.1 protease complex subunit PrcB family protein [Flavobacterium sp. ANB]MTD71486.1 protease complex subunit PrcB family protein [Flavobacterium sp. LC2016-13]